MKTFEKNLGKDVLLREVLKKHIVFLNPELFVKMVMKEWIK